ncbi:hypothetical protein [Corallococcus caeni]|uniref:Cytochrome c domain-containing protein n=1 Tax=Corallococcus caeni TaxID=3082388 RepID=A0ABQ6QNX9_9BACT|nr:hypothetical protein ASNO1_19800 [Corallococcus sp. NO1]
MKRSRQSLMSGVLGLTGCLALSLSGCKVPEADAAEAKPPPRKAPTSNVVPASATAPSDAKVRTPFAAAREAFERNSVNANPFADNNGNIPPSSQYQGPLFSLSHDYPQSPVAPPANPPWIAALKGQPISKANALAYVNALKAYIAPSMQTLLYNYPQWDAAKAGWYNEPWLASIRESIHGTYVGSEFPAATFAASGLKVDMTTYVLTYYDKVAAYALGQVWGKTAMNPTLTNTSAQFPEGSIVIKVALTSALAKDWPVMQGATLWPVYVPPPNGPSNAPPQVMNASVMQFDIIVKDTQTAPKTGWVFSTLVYDMRVPGSAWDKMIPLGAMWGDDPNVNSTQNPGAPLQETVINPAAPEYSTATLGWGGRLSGPNDGAVVDPAIVNGKLVRNVQASSCMSCHSVAEWPMKTFLLPTTTMPPTVGGPDKNALVLEQPGSQAWMKWFQDNPGNVPLDPGTVPMDFDMVFAFKSLPAWQAATQGNSGMKAFEALDAVRGQTPVNPRDLKYNGQ